MQAAVLYAGALGVCAGTALTAFVLWCYHGAGSETLWKGLSHVGRYERKEKEGGGSVS